jgi:hypothetical protein
MQHAAAGVTSALSDERNLNHQAIVSELVSLIERIQASMKLIELALARETPRGGEEVAANVVILDDVTPRYLKANAGLDMCQAGLGLALHVLRDARAP